MADITIYQYLPDLGSYLADTERNLRMSESSWAAYQYNCGPVVYDLLMDFGEFPSGMTYEAIEALVRHLVETYSGMSLDDVLEIEDEGETAVRLVEEVEDYDSIEALAKRLVLRDWFPPEV